MKKKLDRSLVVPSPESFTECPLETFVLLSLWASKQICEEGDPQFKRTLIAAARAVLPKEKRGPKARPELSMALDLRRSLRKSGLKGIELHKAVVKPFLWFYFRESKPWKKLGAIKQEEYAERFRDAVNRYWFRVRKAQERFKNCGQLKFN